MKSIQIGDRLVGPNSPVFIIAELSANHLHDYNLAIKTIDKAFPRYGLTLCIIVIALVFLSAFLVSNRLVLTFTP